MENTRKQKRINKEKVKDIITTIIAKVIYYIITTTVGISALLLVIGALGALVELCTINRLYCICLLIVCSYSIIKWIIKEIY